MKRLFCVVVCFLLLLSVVRTLNGVPALSVQGLLEYCSTFDFGNGVSVVDLFSDISTDFASLWQWSDDLNLFHNLGRWFSSFGSFLLSLAWSVMSVSIQLAKALWCIVKFLLYLFGFGGV